jgi:hypothetical protein
MRHYQRQPIDCWLTQPVLQWRRLFHPIPTFAPFALRARRVPFALPARRVPSNANLRSNAGMAPAATDSTPIISNSFHTLGGTLNASPIKLSCTVRSTILRRNQALVNFNCAQIYQHKAVKIVTVLAANRQPRDVVVIKFVSCFYSLW